MECSSISDELNHLNGDENLKEEKTLLNELEAIDKILQKKNEENFVQELPRQSELLKMKEILPPDSRDQNYFSTSIEYS